MQERNGQERSRQKNRQRRNPVKKRHNLRRLCPPGLIRKNYSGIGAPSGICNLALASAFTKLASTADSDVLRTVASSLTRRYLARSNIFFSRKESGLVRLRATRPFSTAATSINDPVRMRSEFSLKRCFQSWWEAERPFSKNEITAPACVLRMMGRRPTHSTFVCGTITFKPLETIFSI